jgi:diguanylate cyclase (GGDEF)-like protein
MTPGGYEDIQPELTELVFGGLFPTIAIGSAGLILATALMAYLSSDVVLWGLVALVVMAAAARVGLARAYRGRPVDEVLSVEEAQRWERLFGIASIAYAGLVGLITVRVFSRREVAGELLCSVGCVTICAGLSQRYGMRPLLMKVSGLTLLGALGLSSVVFGPLLVKVAGVMAALYGFTFVESVDRNFDRAVEQFRTKRTMLMNSQLDPLTSLPNRKFMKTRLAELCKSGASFAVLFLDLDDFKIVNDTMGHGAGDDLLLQVTARLKAMMRETDLLARVGGDEFAVLQHPAKSKREVVALAERINQQIATPYRIHGEKAVIGVSVGVRLALNGMNEPDDLLHRADAALYNVKAGGKGGYSVALD